MFEIFSGTQRHEFGACYRFYGHYTFVVSTHTRHEISLATYKYIYIYIYIYTHPALKINFTSGLCCLIMPSYEYVKPSPIPSGLARVAPHDSRADSWLRQSASKRQGVCTAAVRETEKRLDYYVLGGSRFQKGGEKKDQRDHGHGPCADCRSATPPAQPGSISASGKRGRDIGADTCLPVLHAMQRRRKKSERVIISGLFLDWPFALVPSQRCSAVLYQ